MKRRLFAALIVLLSGCWGGRLAFARCDVPPLFDFTAPICTPAQEPIECGCAELISWAPVQGAAYYEIVRKNPDGTTVNVGSTASRNHAAYIDSEGTFRAAIKITRWLFAWDSTFPRAGGLYQYDVRACDMVRCGSWSGAWRSYRATAYLCGRTWCNGGPTP